MLKNSFLFLGTFVAGALLALVVRAALFDPHSGHSGHAGQSPAGGNYAPLVSNALAPVVTDKAPSSAKPTADPHAGHEAKAEPSATDKPVNTVCSICGMEVDPKLPTARYQGKTIGFGCRMCPAKFKAEPDRYGPAYLRNEVIEP